MFGRRRIVPMSAIDSIKEAEQSKLVVCEWCSNIFTPAKFHPQQKFCCRYCCKAAYNNSSKRKKSLHIYNTSDKHKKCDKEYSRSYKGKYYGYKWRAKKKCIVFKLSLKDFKLLLSKPCYYCGSKDNIGLDRLDSSKGYGMGNVVPACWICNRAKNILGANEFIKHCKKVAKKWEIL